MKQWILAGVALVAIAGAVAGFLILRPAPSPGAGTTAPVTASTGAGTPSAAAADPGQNPAPPADCLLPGPPPVPPNGATANADDMKLGHDVMQAFVLQLESYQACRNNQIDHAAASVTPAQKQNWLAEGNDAIDEANALAAAFGSQLKIFKARNGGE